MIRYCGTYRPGFVNECTVLYDKGSTVNIRNVNLGGFILDVLVD